MAKHAFEKFINKEPKGAKKKEAFRQEKKRLKKEARAIGEQRRREKWEKQRGILPEERQTPNAERKTPNEKRETRNPKRETRNEKPATRNKYSGSRIVKPEKRKPENEMRNRKPGRVGAKPGTFQNPETSVPLKAVADKRPVLNSANKNQTSKPAIRKEKQEENTKYDVRTRKPETRKPKQEAPNAKQETRNPKQETQNNKPQTPNQKQQTKNEQLETSLIPLNKFIAHAGVCGRREAAELVKQGLVQVNNNLVTEPGFKVSESDAVTVKGKQVFMQNNPVYILLNKPKDYITTSDDPQGRKTVLDIVKKATPERIYPVGRLDRNTTGVLLLTNDGELAQKLTHPSFEVRKVYEVSLDKPLAKKDYEQILQGVTLEDGFVQADVIGYADPKDKSIIGVEIHSGRNRIVRRIFEHLGYDVKNLDRVMFGNLTKKNVERGKWRFLSEKEVRLLKFMNQSFVRKKKSEE